MKNLVIIIFMLSIVVACGCEEKQTHAELEVVQLKAEIEKIIHVSKIDYYREAANLIRQQNEVFQLLVQNEILEGSYQLKDNVIAGEIVNKITFSRSNLTKADQIFIRKWLDFLESYNIYGFRKAPNEIKIYLKPNIYLLFLNGEVNEYRWGEWGGKGTEWKDPRGDIFIKLTSDVVIATERR